MGQQFLWLLSPPVLPLGGQLTSLMVEIVVRLLVVESYFSAEQTKCNQRHTVRSPPPVWCPEPVGPCQRLRTSSSSGFQLLYLQLWGEVSPVEGAGRYDHILQLRRGPN